MSVRSATNNASSCVICGKKVYSGEDTSSETRRKEMCLKFTTLVSRFLKLEQSSESEKNVCKNMPSSSSFVCFNCNVLAQSFCDTYESWESLRMEIIHIVDKISILMSKVSSSSSSSDSFRKDFISRADTKRRKHCPFLQLEKLTDSARDDQDENSINSPNPTEDIIAESLDDCDNDDYNFNEGQEIQFQMEEGKEISHEDDTLHFGDSHDQAESDVFQLGTKDTKAATTAKVESGALRKRKRGQLDHGASVKTAICQICGKDFVTNKRLKMHLVSHSDTRNFICEFCQKGFKGKHALRVHRRSVHLHSLKKLECDICGKKFAYQDQLKRHKISHSETRGSGRRGPRKPYRVKARPPNMCFICHKIFRKQSALEIHLRIHTQEKPFCCQICGQEFAASSSLYVHQRALHVHNDDGSRVRTQCEICGKGVLDIRSHRRKVHCSTKICDICGKAFSGSYRLKDHMVVHTEEKNFSCGICGKRFKHATEVGRHKRKVHKETVPVLDHLINNADDAVLGLPTNRLDLNENPK